MPHAALHELTKRQHVVEGKGVRRTAIERGTARFRVLYIGKEFKHESIINFNHLLFALHHTMNSDFFLEFLEKTQNSITIVMYIDL